jgi:hypothetical protein
VKTVAISFGAAIGIDRRMDLDNSGFDQFRHRAMQGGPGQAAVVD